MGRKEALSHMRSVLLNRRDAIRRALDGDKSALARNSHVGGELIDVAFESSNKEINGQIVAVGSQELSNIENALEKFNTDRFGVCDGCEEPIPTARLEALPYADLCIKCQVKMEKAGYSNWSDLVADAYSEDG